VMERCLTSDGASHKWWSIISQVAEYLVSDGASLNDGTSLNDGASHEWWSVISLVVEHLTSGAASCE